MSFSSSPLTASEQRRTSRVENGSVETHYAQRMEIRSIDGVDVQTVIEGTGPTVLILHGGMSDESAWAAVAAKLATQFRVVRLRRRLYRVDLVPDPAMDYAMEVQDVIALVETFDAPCLVVGHSSGAVVALEALVARPGAFNGAVLYEPPIPDLPLGEPDSLSRARAALARGRIGRANRIFLAEAVRAPLPAALAVGLATRAVRQLRTLGPRQIDDWDALRRLGPRLTAYATIQTPTLLLTGEHSPEHLRQRVRLLAEAMPLAIVQELHGQSHGANLRAPGYLAEHIADFARTLRAA